LATVKALIFWLDRLFFSQLWPEDWGLLH